MVLVHVVAFSMLPRQNPKGVRVNWVMVHIKAALHLCRGNRNIFAVTDGK